MAYGCMGWMDARMEKCCENVGVEWRREQEENKRERKRKKGGVVQQYSFLSQYEIIMFQEDTTVDATGILAYKEGLSVFLYWRLYLS